MDITYPFKILLYTEISSENLWSIAMLTDPAVPPGAERKSTPAWRRGVQAGEAAPPVPVTPRTPVWTGDVRQHSRGEGRK